MKKCPFCQEKIEDYEKKTMIVGDLAETDAPNDDEPMIFQPISGYFCHTKCLESSLAENGEYATTEFLRSVPTK